MRTAGGGGRDKKFYDLVGYRFGWLFLLGGGWGGWGVGGGNSPLHAMIEVITETLEKQSLVSSNPLPYSMKLFLPKPLHSKIFRL